MLLTRKAEFSASHVCRNPALSEEQQNERVIRAWDEACAQYIMVEEAAAELTRVIAGAQKGKSNG